MQYKDEFICEGTEGYVIHVLPHRKKESGCRIGQMIAEQFGHTIHERPDGEKVYKLEFIAVPINNYHRFLSRLEGILMGDPEGYSEVINALRDMHELDSQPTT